MSKIIFDKWNVNLLSEIQKDQFIFIVDDVLNVQLPKESIVMKCQAGENLKTFSMLEKALTHFLDHGVTRNTHLVAIGGGSVSDFAGLVASLLLRGISWSVVPTTLLSMVDASIGGKTAINTSKGKNLVGSFHLPDNIFIDERFLETLPLNELESGKGEVLKYCFLNEDVFSVVTPELNWDKIIKSCAAYKSSIVNEDLNEGGLRKLLNLGHTFGHAIEKTNSISHGLAVVYGIEIILSLYGTKKSMEEFNDLKERLEINNLELEKLNLNIEKIINYIKSDKKNVGGGEVELIVVKDVGDVIIHKKNILEIEKDFRNLLKSKP